jgi:uncharacterized membrane protein
MKTLQVTRITSIDLLRGLIMIIMALDHTRDYFHKDAFLFDPLDLEKTSVLLFFTRWITHFCAPIFVLLAGTSAFLSGQKKTKKELSIFLVKRGCWLIFLELTVVNFSWFFNIHFSFILLAVIWALGVSMICLAALIHLPRKWLLVVSLLLICAHNLLDGVHHYQNDATGFIWGLLHDSKIYTTPYGNIFEGYPVIPWIGVMALGYYMGAFFAKDFDVQKRKKILITLGCLSWIAFILLRTINIYGNIKPWANQPSMAFSILSFINVSKYPPSLDYLLVTEGFAFIFLGLTENISNRITKIISVYGRVPMFYYILHIYMIHLVAMAAAVFTGFPWTAMTGFTSWISNSPQLTGYGFSLGVVYVIWISIVIILYPLCKKYDRYKSSHRDKWWLSYL